MKRNITIFFALLSVSFAFGQGKYKKYLNSKKLALAHKSVKDSDKEDYYQQYYWLVKAEQLKTYPHLKDVKPVVLYEFVKKVNPHNPTKKLDAKGMIEETKCDAIMIGRGVVGNPFLIKQILNYNKGKRNTKITYKQRFKQLINHTNKLIKLKGEKGAIYEMRGIQEPPDTELRSM